MCRRRRSIGRRRGLTDRDRRGRPWPRTICASLEASIERAVAMVAAICSTTGSSPAAARRSIGSCSTTRRSPAAAHFPTVQCNAPWVSAVLEPDGNLRPCFFHPAYGSAAGGLEDALNSPQAIAFRQSLDVERNPDLPAMRLQLEPAADADGLGRSAHYAASACRVMLTSVTGRAHWTSAGRMRRVASFEGTDASGLQPVTS